MPDNKQLRQNEDEYFLKHDAELIKQYRVQLDAERAARAEAERQAHYMKCPKCGVGLVETDFHHVRVDVCPSCKGFWFDRGELEMLGYVPFGELRRFYREHFGSGRR